MLHKMKLSILELIFIFKQELTNYVRPLFNCITWHSCTRDERNRSIFTSKWLLYTTSLFSFGMHLAKIENNWSSLQDIHLTQPWSALLLGLLILTMKFFSNYYSVAKKTMHTPSPRITHFTLVESCRNANA